MWNKLVWHCQNPSAEAIAFISFLVIRALYSLKNSQATTKSAPSRSKVLLEEFRVALERTRSSFVSSGLLAVLVVLSGFYLHEASAAEQAKPDPAIEKRIQELIPSLEGYIASGMKAFDAPGLAMGLLDAKLRKDIRDLIALAVAQASGCDYTLSTMHAIGRGGGLGADDLTAARGAEANDPKTAAALRFAAKIVDEREHLSAVEVDTLRGAGFSDGEVTEIIACVVLNIFRSYFNLIAAPEIDFPVVRTSALAE